MKAKPDIKETKQRFEAWWNGNLNEAPLLTLIEILDEPKSGSKFEPAGEYPEITDLYLNYKGRIADFRNRLNFVNYLADSYPSLSLDLGPGSMALYLGSDPIFSRETVWYSDVVKNTWKDYPLKFDPENKWWKLHLEMIRNAHDAAGGEFYVNIPDIIENMDILAAMRGPQASCFDLVDEPEIIHERLNELDELYFKYYDAMYDIVKDDENFSSFTAFHVLGPGKTGKVQCDFAAMLSPEMFKEFIVPSLNYQCSRLNQSIFHLDGPDCIRHIPALMSVESLKALQWTPGEGKPDGGDERWFPIYDKVREAGKSLWIHVDGDADEMIGKARKLVKRYGINALYVLMAGVRSDGAQKVLKEYAKGFK